jgi:hypothetical protein
MATDQKPLARGDHCPACDGDFRAAKVPTPAQRDAAARRENAVALPAHYDTATAEDRATLGALFVCASCGYKTRFLIDAQAQATA